MNAASDDNMIKALIFDADNTLYRINRARSTEEMLEFLHRETGAGKERINRVFEEVKKEVRSSQDPEQRKREYAIKIALYRMEIDPNSSEKISKSAADIFNSAIVRDLEYDNENRKILRYLKGKYKICIASDEFEGFLKMKLNKALTDYRKYFSFLVTPEKTGTMKPSPKYLEIALKRLGAGPDECVMIGDSWERDLMPASEMGIKTILVGERIEGSPNHWVKSLKELVKIL